MDLTLAETSNDMEMALLFPATTAVTRFMWACQRSGGSVNGY